MNATTHETNARMEISATEVDFQSQANRVHRGVDRLFGCLMLVQLLACVAAALWLTPYTWSGDDRALHVHVLSVLTVGAAATLFPALLCWRRPGEPTTRYAVAVAQMVVSALLIHISGGRIEMHFHIFGSLAFLAAYRDWRVIAIASVVVAIDHIARGLFWPVSVFGVDQPALWRALEHAGWVAFEDVILFCSIAQAIREMRTISAANVRTRRLLAAEEEHAREVERLNAGLERRVEERTQELDAERDLLESLIDGLPNAVFWKTPDGAYAGCNRAFVEFVKAHDPAEVIGHLDNDLAWEPETLANKLRNEQGVLETRSSLVDAQVTKTLADGTARDVIASKTVLGDSSGAVRGIVGIYTDVTELNRLRTQVQDSEKLQAVGRLAAGIAHEINTPIQSAAANISFLRAGVEQLLELAARCATAGASPANAASPAPSQDGPFEHLKRHAPSAVEDSAVAIERVTEIVRAMRVMSHPGAESMVATDVNTLARSAATITRSRWKDFAELELELDAGLPSIDCHGSEISQVLLNLIVNAGDAIADNRADDDPLGKIFVRTRAADDGILVEVEDTGGGVPEEIRDQIFEPFFTTKDVGQGTGQGLSICYNAVVKTHGGRIDLDSTPGVGSTFRIWLPDQQRESDPDATEERTEQASA